jgi:hypothetical protein
MANTLLTPSIIARESLMVLQNNMVMFPMVYHDYSMEFANVGDTITIRKPTTFEVKEFSTEIVVQDAKETGVPVVMDKLLDVSFAVTSRDMALNISDFSTQFLQPAMRAFAQDIDKRILDQVKSVPYYIGTKGAATTSAADITLLRKVMNQNKVPMDGRSLVIDPIKEQELLALEQFTSYNQVGTTDAMTNASLGRKYGFDIFMDQNVAEIGSTFAGTAVATSTTLAIGNSTISFAGTGMSGVIKQGDIFTVAGDPNKYVVSADSTPNATAGTLTFSPSNAVAWASGATITIVGAHTANVAFHQHAFAMVSRQLAQPMGNALSSYINYNGLGLRVVQSYDNVHKTDTVSIDMLCGFKTIQPELACRFIE